MAKLYNINGHPFVNLSAEEERSYIMEIFYKQQYYDSLLDTTEVGASRFILGQRGQGKSATILHLFEDMKSRNILPILIDQYNDFPLQGNEKYFLYKIIQKMTFSIAQHLMKEPKARKELSPNKKEQLAFFIEAFYDKESAADCEALATNIQAKKRKNKLKSWYNRLLCIFNQTIGIVVKVGVDLIKSYSGVNVNSDQVASNYLNELSIETFNQIPMEEMVTLKKDKLIDMINCLKDISRQLGNKTVVIMFDKIDEVSSINLSSI